MFDGPKSIIKFFNVFPLIIVLKKNGFTLSKHWFTESSKYIGGILDTMTLFYISFSLLTLLSTPLDHAMALFLCSRILSNFDKGTFTMIWDSTNNISIGEMVGSLINIPLTSLCLSGEFATF